LSPCDSRILSICKINGDQNLLIKEQNYSLGELLVGVEGYKIEGVVLESMKRSVDKSQTSLHSVIFYLNPGDYHR